MRAPLVCACRRMSLLRANSRGIAAVEFAFLAPVVLLLLAGATDLGRAIDSSIRLENAARAGAQFALRAPNDTAGIRAAAEAGAGPGATVTVTRPPCQCPTAAGANGAVVACNANCTTGMASYVRISITRPFVPLFPTSALIPFDAIGATNANVLARLS